MVKVQFLGLSPECVEGFPEGTKRALKGALHLKPNQVYDISKEEFAHMKAIRSDLKFHEFKLGNKVVKPKNPKKKKKDSKKDDKSVSDKGLLHEAKGTTKKNLVHNK